VNEINDSAILAALRRQMATAVAKQTAAASNLANIDTPGYKAREVSVVETQGLPERRDGNNVQLERELLALKRASGDFPAAQKATSLRDMRTTGAEA
jgi:flagellar basal body rod protein FlgB